DGIRDGHVTGVQTCALPILFRAHAKGARHLLQIAAELARGRPKIAYKSVRQRFVPPELRTWDRDLTARARRLRRRHRDLTHRKRSEERRVGKECMRGYARWQ